MKKLFWLFGLLFSAGVVSAAPFRVVATTPDLADLARQVGGDRTTVDSLSKGNQDPHFVEAKPSLILKVRDADLFIQTGLELEVGWAPVLLQASRNARIQFGAPGFLDASAFITPLEVPTTLSRSAGDVHPGGNPHYLADPLNAVAVARGIAEKMAELDPSNATIYAKNAEDYTRRLEGKIAEWKRLLASAQGTPFVSYHKNLVYFGDRFGLVGVGEIEPKPGIPPTPKHTEKLIALMKARSVPLVFTMPHYGNRTSESLAKATGAKVVTMALVPGAVPEATDYIATMDYNVAGVLKALGK
jgi:zinc/manganese transport system substrate-binding protein